MGEGLRTLRRPLLYVAVGLAVSIIVCYYAGLKAFVPGAAVLAFALFLYPKSGPESIRTGVILFTVAFLLGGGRFLLCSFSWSGESMTGTIAGDRAITGTVRDASVKKTSSGEEYVQLVVEPDASSADISDGKRVLARCYEGSISSSFKGEIPPPGCRVDLRGKVEIPQEKRNPGCFDYRLYLKSLNISRVMTVNKLYVNPSPGSFAEKAEKRLFLMKEAYFNRLSENAGEETSSLMKAIMFGDKGELDEEVLETFQRNGTAHVLAVSGLHIGIIYGFILRLWGLAGYITRGRICGRRGVSFMLFNTVFFGCYMFLAGFSPSVVRAVFMVLLHTFAKMTGRRYDLGNAAFLVTIGVLVKNPFMLFNMGFQMSFLAVLTLSLVLPYIRRIYQGIFLSSIVIQLGIGPFILYNFNYLSPVAVLINVPVIGLAGVIVPAGLVDMFLGEAVPGSIIAKAIGGLCLVLKWINNVAEIPGITTFLVASPDIRIVAFYYIVLLVLASEEGRRIIIRRGKGNRKRYILRVCVVLTAVSLAFGAMTSDGFRQCNLTFVDVGQGDCMCIDAGKHYMIDGGGKAEYSVGEKILKPYLLKNGIRYVDGAFVTHLHTDHYKGICELARQGMIKKLFVYEGNRCNEKQILKDTGLEPEDIEYIYAGQQISLGGKRHIAGRETVKIQVLWPVRGTDSEYAEMNENSDDENTMSLVFKICFCSNSRLFGSRETSLLVTGDMGEEIEPEIHESADILKVGHHGSRTSTSDEFLDTVGPEIAVIQVGKNNYGHPTPEVLEKLASRGVTVYRNDLSGAVGIEIKKGEVRKIRRMIE